MRKFGCWVWTVCAALSGFCVETETQYLSGHGKDDGVPWAFFCTAGMHSNVWTTISVPSCWEQQGFGAYGYQKDPLAEQGKYRRDFQIPAAWKDKTVRLVFDGVMTDTEAWINGASAGPVHQGGFYRFKYDVTKLLKFGGTNRLEVTVSKHSANEGVNRAERSGDYWNFGGIFRPVYLEALPKRFIDRVAIDARADGSFHLDVFFGGAPAGAERVIAVIEGADMPPLETAVAPGADRTALTARVAKHKNWTAETPSLYRVNVSLVSDGRSLHAVSQRFGFRTVEVREGKGLFINGQRVMLKGACRHSFWPESGRTLSEAVSRGDVALLKAMNMNAVRMSHYPPDTHFLDACDEAGLYVLDELSGWQKSHETEVGHKLVREMVTRDVNHPCIVFWDNGNEGGWNTALDGDFAQWDPQGRHVLHPWAVSQGVDTAHYRNYETVKKSLSETAVYMPTEFLHALYDGGGGAGLDDYWNLMRASPVSAGGFIWALLDEGVVRTDQGGRIDVYGNRAPDGLVGPHREHEGSFNTVREIWCPIQVRADALPVLAVENRYDFTDLAECRFDWSLVRFPLPQESGTGSISIANGVVKGPRVPPHAGGTLRLDLPKNWPDAEALTVTARNSAGAAVWTWTWPLQSSDAQVTHLVGENGSVDSTGHDMENATRLFVTSGDVMLSFHKDTGRLAGVFIRGNPVLFKNGPRFVASVTQTRLQEQGPGKKPKRVTSMLDLSGASKLLKLMKRSNGLDATFDGPLRETHWTLLSNGWVRLSYAYRLDAPCDLAGVQFDYPEKMIKTVRWLGDGPYRVWKNRLKGTRWNVWQNTYHSTVPGESWRYPEFKGYFGDWRWAVFETAEGRITLLTESDHGYLGVYRPNDGPAPAHTKVYTPQTGLAFFDAIPPIGTKFSDADQYGPQSQVNPPPGMVRRTVWLRFD